MILINDDCRKVLKDVLNDTENPIIVSDPPFNIGYRYRKYKDRMPENEYYSMLAEIFGGVPALSFTTRKIYAGCQSKCRKCRRRS